MLFFTCSLQTSLPWLSFFNLLLFDGKLILITTTLFRN